MREIKFRAWDKVLGELAPWEDFLLREGDPTEQFVMYTRRDQYAWMQYTGLKDKNGKEIYEGDVLDYRQPYWDEFHGEGDEMQIEGQVLYEDGHWLVQSSVKRKDIWSQSHPYYSFGLHEMYEEEMSNTGEISFFVVGNIYENPELLKGSN